MLRSLAVNAYLRNESTDKAPAPVIISDSKPAIYNRLISKPGGPNNGPEGVSPMVLTELKPYFICIVNIAVSIVMIRGTETHLTNSPINIAIPPRTSTKGTIQERRWAKGVWV